MSRLAFYIVSLCLTYHSYCQSVGIRNIYLNLPFPELKNSNPLEFGATLKCNQSFEMYTAVNTFYTVNGFSAVYNAQTQLYQPKNDLFYALKHNDSIAYFQRNVAQRAFGFCLGLSLEFDLGKLQLISRTALNPMLVKHKVQSETGYIYFTDSSLTGIPDRYESIYYNKAVPHQSVDWMFSPQLNTELGVVFTMADKIQFTPKIQFIVSGMKTQDYLGYLQNNRYQIDLDMWAGIQLAYRFNYFY
ncbi:MAG: hypothetical protein RLZZ337_1437 [Bacteroidota bacterium]